jgi:xylan 1,4-beta-xylosidase
MRVYAIFIFLILGSGITGNAQGTQITISESALRETYNMPWKKMITVGRAYDLTRSDLLEHLAYVQREIGYEYCRFHAIFDDDMAVVRREPDGRLVFQWHQVNKVYDALLSMGLKPFIELNPMPLALASGDKTIFRYKMNVTPPRDYAEWGLLVSEFTKHLISRYGLEEVKTWYFEVWNEPNLPGFWDGTQEEYWKLYETSARAIKAIDPAFRVGGPASSKGFWIADIIRFCSENNVPIDFVSTHLYPQDEFVAYPDKKSSPYGVGEFFTSIVREVQETVKNSSMPHLEIHWTEWNTQSAKSSKEVSWTRNIFVDNLYAASFIVRNCLALDDAAQSFGYWVASDIFAEAGIPHAPFSSTYGLVTIHGIPKASFNGFYFLNKMRGHKANLYIPQPIPVGSGAAAVKEGDTWRVLLWNHQPIEVENQPVWKGTIVLQDVKDTEMVATKARIGLGAGSTWETWKIMGSPLNLTRQQEEVLRYQSSPEYTVTRLPKEIKAPRVDFSLNPGEVVLYEFTPRSTSFIQREIDDKQLLDWEKSMGEKSR